MGKDGYNVTCVHSAAANCTTRGGFRILKVCGPVSSTKDGRIKAPPPVLVPMGEGSGKGPVMPTPQKIF